MATSPPEAASTQESGGSTSEATTSSSSNADKTSTSSTSTTATKGVAGRINYAQWDKVATDLVKETEQEEADEKAQEEELLGLNGKYARSEAEATERAKAEKVAAAKQRLDSYQEREKAVMQTMTQVFGNSADASSAEESKSTSNQTVRITRNDMQAGTRVLTVSDSAGSSLQNSTIVLTQDLSLLESQMAGPTNPHAKTYADDAENDAPNPDAQAPRKIFGLIKAFFRHVSDCTILVKCKLISGTIELHHCDNVVVKVMGPHATVATVQIDVSKNVTVEFHDAPSGKNSPLPHQTEPSLYWGQDKDDRIFHAGVSNLCVKLYRDGMIDSQCTADYLKDGAVSVGNATAEEQQYVTSVVNGTLQTEAVVRTGSTTGSQVRAMTERELAVEEQKRKAAAARAEEMAQGMLKITDKQGNPVVSKKVDDNATSTTSNNGETAVEEEVVSPAVKVIVDECLQNKAKGNEAFGAGEYGQAILLYSLALDKADELPKDDDDDDATTSSTDKLLLLFPRDVVYSNRAACFLKLGQHEKAEQDAQMALQLNPDNLKALFRRGLALHAMQRYQEALPLLAKASKLEPKNKQIQQALQFCEVRMEQEHRKRVAGGM